MELRQLRYFAAVAAHGSFSRAAKELHLTQPAVSRQVLNLEEELGSALLRRTNNAVALTAAGEQFYEEARDLLTRADQAVRRVRAQASSATLRVSYVASLLGTGTMVVENVELDSNAPEPASLVAMLTGAGAATALALRRRRLAWVSIPPRSLTARFKVSPPSLCRSTRGRDPRLRDLPCAPGRPGRASLSCGRTGRRSGCLRSGKWNPPSR